MWEKIKNNEIIILLFITGAVYFFLKYLTPLLAPVLTAVLFVTMFGPLLKDIHDKFHINRQIGAVFLLILAGVFLSLILWILISWIVGSLPSWVSGLSSVENEILDFVSRTCSLVGKLVGVDSVYLENMLVGKINEGFDTFKNQILHGVLTQSLQYAGIIIRVGGFLITFIITTVLLAKDYDDIMNRLLDREDCHVFLELMCGIIRYIATYVKAQLIIMAVISGVAVAGLSLLQIRHGVLWGTLAGLLDALPLIGTGVVLIPLAISQFFAGSYAKGIFCLGIYGLCAFVREITEPKLIGKSIGVTPVMVLISLYVGIRLFGAWGIIKGPLGFILIYQSYLSITHKGILG